MLFDFQLLIAFLVFDGLLHCTVRTVRVLLKNKREENEEFAKEC